MVPTHFQLVSRELITLRLIFCVDRASDTRTVTEELSLGNRSAYLGDSGLARELGNFSGCGVDKCFSGENQTPKLAFFVSLTLILHLQMHKADIRLSMDTKLVE
jgi:hypothetical protein